MAKQYYLPQAEGNLVTWLQNYKVKIAEHGASLGLSTAEISAQQASCDNIIAAIAIVEQKKQDARQEVQSKNNIKDTELGSITNKVAQLKVENAYTDVIGKDLGIIGEEDSTDPATSKPTLDVSKVPSGWKFAFNLQGFFDGIKLYRKRPTDSNFSFIAMDTRSPYIDTDEQIDGTQYYAYYLQGDDEVGQQSDIATVGV